MAQRDYKEVFCNSKEILFISDLLADLIYSTL